MIRIAATTVHTMTQQTFPYARLTMGHVILVKMDGLEQNVNFHAVSTALVKVVFIHALETVRVKKEIALGKHVLPAVQRLIA